ncbi:MAG: fumarate reductase (quinol) flavoprotein subunit [Deltaproteobacteria bacterium]|nr:MAG: fumarate reductase (quinol) flavoprotein subunit [Deltaproteobacteria bacterium]
MVTVHAEVLVIGGGGAGLRAAIAAAESGARVALLSKVYPMRSHTVAAEGGAAGVAQPEDDLEAHFRDTVAGGDWLCDQSAVSYFVAHATAELTWLEHHGCPWSREPDGRVAVRKFGGMKRARTWFAADKSGFHILQTLFHTALALPSIDRFDEFFCTGLLVHDGVCHGVMALRISTGEPYLFLAPSVVLATGGAGRVYRFNTNGSIVTGDGLAMAWRAGLPLRDMEFVQVHPTALPGSGVLITEACRGEGGILLNAEGRRYLQDYGLGPETPPGQPRNKTMELGPRDRLSQAFWHEQRAGRTVPSPRGDAVHLDLRHLGAERLAERLPLICSLSEKHVGIHPKDAPIPVRPAVHYTMGGVPTSVDTSTAISGLYAAGECASVGLHGANRLGSNSLAELLVFGRAAGERAAARARAGAPPPPGSALGHAREHLCAIQALRAKKGTVRLAELRDAMGSIMDECFGIYRLGPDMERGLSRLVELRESWSDLELRDASERFNTELIAALELSCALDVALAIGASAAARKESRGSHQRLDAFSVRDDERFLAHSLVDYAESGVPAIRYGPVEITSYPPEERVYGGEAQVGDS